MVIIILGIIAMVAQPRLERDLRQEAADNILSAIRYTQYLALIDNKTNPSKDDWQKAFWSFGTQNCKNKEGLFYYIGSDADLGGNINKNEVAIDPSNGLLINGINGVACDEKVQVERSPNIFLTKQYGISSVDWSDCKNVQHIAFDYLGRVHSEIRHAKNDYATYISTACKISFKFLDKNIADLNIIIEPETGFVQIVD